MWASEAKLPARGVKFYFIIKQNIPKKEHQSWQDTIMRLSPLFRWFKRVEFGYSDHPTLINDWKGWNLVKIFCPDTNISIKPSDVESSYKEIFVKFSEWFVKLCKDRKIECKPYDFRILFRLRPSETPDEFVPCPSLQSIAKFFVSPPSLVSYPPVTLDTVLSLASKSLSIEATEVVIKYAEEKNLKVYVGYGIRTEEDANTYELDISLPNKSEEVESMRSLPGELWHELILQSPEKAPPDFNNVVKALLTKLLQYEVIDSKKLEHIYQNPSDYVETTQWQRRFILKFDLKMVDLNDEKIKRLDLVKKGFQKELVGSKYYLFGAFFYKLAEEDLTKIEKVIENIIYFRNAKRDALFTNISIFLVDSTYERIIEIARKSDEILNSHKIIDLDILPEAAIDIEDAKKRWSSAMSDSVRDGRRVTSFMLFREINGVPLQIFMNVQEALCKELKTIAVEANINATITSDNQSSIRYGCYIGSSQN
jgi:hypothetical protein